VLAIVLALASAIGYGGSDFAARLASRERLTAMRLGGLALAGVCVSLIGVGGAS